MKFEKPLIDVIELNNDIICTSTKHGSSGNMPGGTDGEDEM